MAVSVRIEINSRFLNRLLRSPAGPVAANMLKRGRRVRDAARRNVNSQSGRLARSIEVSVVGNRGATGAQVGTSLYYAKYVHDGTGIYGPRGVPIKPQRGKVLVFAGRDGTTFAKSVAGQPGTKFLLHALDAAG